MCIRHNKADSCPSVCIRRATNEHNKIKAKEKPPLRGGFCVAERTQLIYCLWRAASPVTNCISRQAICRSFGSKSRNLAETSGPTFCRKTVNSSHVMPACLESLLRTSDCSNKPWTAVTISPFRSGGRQYFSIWNSSLVILKNKERRAY